jgi:hypothetical protein
MPFLPPDQRIARHVEKLLGYRNPENVDVLLERCGLYRSGGTIHSKTGFITDETCYSYKQAVKAVYGDSSYAFAKVNFLLSGCSCADCNAPR